MNYPLMKLLLILVYCTSILMFDAHAQITTNTDFEINEVTLYEPLRGGGFVAARTICFKQFKAIEYRDIRDKTLPLMNQMSALDRNQAMGSFKKVNRNWIFDYHKLTNAQCQRIVNSDWQNYLLK